MSVVERHAAPKQERSQAKLERLLAAGRLLFAQHGFDGTRISDIVDAAQCSVGVFYHRFDDKDAFFVAVQDHFLAEIVAASGGLNDQAADLGGVELLRAHVANAVRIFRHNAGLIRAFLHYEVSHPTFELPMRLAVDAATERLVEAVLQSGTPVGHPDPPAAIALVAQVVRGTLVQEVLRGPGDLDDDTLIDELTAMVAAYLRMV